MSSIKKQQTVINQHYVARSYLRPWTNKIDQVWLFKRESGESFQTNVENVASEKFFYDVPETLDRSNEATFQMVEHAWSDIEGQGLKSINNALSVTKTLIGRKLPFNERNKPALMRVDFRNLLSYVALQYLRTKDMRDFIREVLTKNTQRILEETAPIQFPDIDASSLRAEVSESHIKREHILITFKSFNEFFNVLEKKIVVLGINSTSTSLVTSDNPVVRIGTPIHPNIPFDGLDSPGMWIAMPFSPQFALCLYDRSLFTNLTKWDNQARQLTIEEVREMNEKQLLQCSRFIFSNRDSFKWARMLLAKNPELSQKREERYQANNDEMDSLVERMKMLAREYKAESVAAEEVSNSDIQTRNIPNGH